MPELGYLEKLFVFERDSYMFTFNFSLRTVKNLCPNLQKPPLPSKIPGYAPGQVMFYLWKIRSVLKHYEAPK